MWAWLGRWAERWRRLRAGAWLPTGTAVAQWTLVACAAVASGAHTLGFLGRAAASGRSLDGLGWFAQAAGGVGAVAAVAAYLVVTPLTWWLLWASFRSGGANPTAGRQHRRAVWRRIWLLVLGVLGPPIGAALLFGEWALAVAPIWTLAEVPFAALALWAFGAYLLLGYWMRRVCLRLGLAGLAIHLAVRRFELLPRWMVEWPRAGGALGLADAEAQYLSFFTLSIMAFGFVVLGSMMLAAAPLTAPGPIVLTPPPVPPLPGPTATAPARPPEPSPRVEFPTHPSGRAMRRFDL
jgi:hypothetical protein